MNLLSIPIPELFYTVFSLTENALSTACVVWLCWQYPALGRRPLAAFLIVGALLIGTPLIVAFGHCFSRMTWDANWIGLLFAWNLLWTVTAIPFVILTMVLIRRVTGISITSRSVTPPPRHAISIRDLFIWTLVVAIVCALTGAVSGLLQDSLSSFGASFSGSAAVGYAVVQAIVFGTSIYVLLPNLSSSIWFRALIAYTIHLMGSAAYVALMTISGEASAISPDHWMIMTIRSASTTLGMILGHRLLMARGYQYWIRPKRTIHAVDH